MSEGVWIGSIYLKDEGGHEIVLRSLRYYLKILANISAAPEEYGPRMIAQLLEHEANKMGPTILEVRRNLMRGLTDTALLADIRDHIPHIKRALESYESGVRSAMRGDRHYCGLVPEKHRNEKEIRLITEAKRRITESV